MEDEDSYQIHPDEAAVVCEGMKNLIDEYNLSVPKVAMSLGGDSSLKSWLYRFLSAGLNFSNPDLDRLHHERCIKFKIWLSNVQSEEE